MNHYHVRVERCQHQRDSAFRYILDMKTLAERLVWARTQKEMSQEALAAKAGVSQSTIGNLEAGIRSAPRKLAQIASALEVSALWLADGTGPMTPDENEAKTDITGMLTPEEIVELITLYGNSGPEGRRAIMSAARGAANADPLPASDDQFKLRR